MRIGAIRENVETTDMLVADLTAIGADAFRWDGQMRASSQPEVLVLDLALCRAASLSEARQTGAAIIAIGSKEDDATLQHALQNGEIDAYALEPITAHKIAGLSRALERGTRERTNARVADAISLGELHLDADKRQAVWGDESVALRPAEFNLLHALIRRAGDLVGRTELAQEVLLNPGASPRSIDVFVLRLRRKLAQLTPDVRIETVPGTGYRLELRAPLSVDTWTFSESPR